MPQQTGYGADLALWVKWDDAVFGAAPHDNMTAILTHYLESRPLPRAQRFAARNPEAA